MLLVIDRREAQSNRSHGISAAKKTAVVQHDVL